MTIFITGIVIIIDTEGNGDNDNNSDNIILPTPMMIRLTTIMTVSLTTSIPHNDNNNWEIIDQ